MTSKKNTVLYIGVTGNLNARVFQHKNRSQEGFTKRYNVDKLVYYECGEDAYGALTREKQLKGVSRHRKIQLINSMNPEWRDLYEDIKEG